MKLSRLDRKFIKCDGARVLVALVFSLMCFSPIKTSAWGKRGHEIVSVVASEILLSKENFSFFQDHELDLKSYSNVPDTVWKRSGEGIYKIEDKQHFIDWNEKFIAHFESPKNLPVEYAKYKKAMGSDESRNLGLAPWRISQFVKLCKGIRQELASGGALEKDSTGSAAPNKGKIQNIKGRLLLCLGELSHYSGDLSQPLHVTDNYDGQMTRQKGIHSYFETVLVDSLGETLNGEVLEEAKKKFDTLKVKKNSSDENVRYLIGDSYAHVTELLKLDQQSSRKPGKVFHASGDDRERFHSFIVERLATGAAITALLWKDILGEAEPMRDFSFVPGGMTL